MGRAIVTFARGWQALAATRSLGRRSIEVYCGEEAPFAPCFFSRYCKGHFRYPSVSDHPEAFVDFMVEKVKELKPKDGEPYVLLPVHKETWLIAKHRERFEPHIGLALADYDKMARIHDKGKLADLAQELDIRIPPTHQFRSVDEVYRNVPSLKFPVFLKVREGASGVGIKKCDTAEELTVNFKTFVEGYKLAPEVYPLVQEAVDGEDYCVTALFEHGRLVAKMTYRSVRAFPRTTGATALRESVPFPEGEAVAEKILSHMDWHGIAELDFRRDPDGRAYLIEVNPRMFGGLHQSIVANVDYPALLFRIAGGETLREIPEVDYTPRTETPVTGLLATLDDIVRDDKVLGRLRRLRDELSRLGHSDVRDLRIRPFWKALKDATNPRDLAALLKEKFGVHHGTVDDIIASDDPLPVLGVLFPAAMMLKQGKLTMGLLTGEADLSHARPRRRFRDMMHSPGWRTLGLTALLFALSVFFVNWEATADNIGLVLSWPMRLGKAIFGQSPNPGTLWGAFAHTLTHVVNLFILYFLSALLLREGRTRRGEVPPPPESIGG